VAFGCHSKQTSHSPYCFISIQHSRMIWIRRNRIEDISRRWICSFGFQDLGNLKKLGTKVNWRKGNEKRTPFTQ
jgi:hypothetical protein